MYRQATAYWRPSVENEHHLTRHFRSASIAILACVFREKNNQLIDNTVKFAMVADDSSVREKRTLADYAGMIDQRLAELYPTSNSNFMNQVICWAMNGGKRIRPAMALDIISSCGVTLQTHHVDAALAIEFIHAASLIIDDLPCMDNSVTRRGSPTVHVRYGETVAQLAAVSMLSDAIKIVLNALDDMVNTGTFTTQRAEHLGMLLMRVCAEKIGLLGASGGQLVEFASLADNYKKAFKFTLTEENGKLSISQITDYVDKKTGAFFEVAFAIGYLLGERDETKLSDFLHIAKCFGRLYQMQDDMEDAVQDSKVAHSINYCNLFGDVDVKNMYEKERRRFLGSMKHEGILSPFFVELLDKLDWKMSKCE